MEEEIEEGMEVGAEQDVDMRYLRTTYDFMTT